MTILIVFVLVLVAWYILKALGQTKVRLSSVIGTPLIVGLIILVPLLIWLAANGGF